MFTKKAARTNLINRLIVIVTEDISIEEYEALIMSDEVLSEIAMPDDVD